MVDPLTQGYATAATDDGHDGGAGATWAVGHPEKLIDFGYRAVHETSVQAKAVIRAFYGRDASLNYFAGCSDGGREALMEAQRYPEDFNGILAGAPASNWSHLFTGFVWNEQALLNSPGSSIPPAKLPVLQNAVLAACDSQDGLKDGLLSDPRTCRFDPAVLLCKDTDGPNCLTARAGGCRQENLRRREESAHRRTNLSGMARRRRSGSRHVGHVDYACESGGLGSSEFRQHVLWTSGF